MIHLTWGVKGQKGINQWLVSEEVSKSFYINRNRFYAYEILTWNVNTKLDNIFKVYSLTVYTKETSSVFI